MIVHLANKTQFQMGILSKRIEEIAHESVKKQQSGAIKATYWEGLLKALSKDLTEKSAKASRSPIPRILGNSTSHSQTGRQATRWVAFLCKFNKIEKSSGELLALFPRAS